LTTNESQTALAVKQTRVVVEDNDGWTDERIDVVRRTVAKDCNDHEFALFLLQCKRTGLDPLARQIHVTKRKGQVVIQTGIDGYRLIADRTGRYAGNDDPVFDDEGRPRRATVTVYKIVGAVRCPFTATARWDQYYPGDAVGFMWKKMPHLMLGKCFTPDTEILTSAGFQRLDSVTGDILQVAQDGLEATGAVPFVQPYTGGMIACHGDMLNFAVTPNHDMVTTVGKVEAGAMYATSRTKPVWRIPLRLTGSLTDNPACHDDDLQLAGYVIADGWHSDRAFKIAVSRQYKRQALSALPTLKSVGVQHCRGAVAVSESRSVRSNFDKQVFTFPEWSVGGLIDTEKRLNLRSVLSLSMRQARVMFDAWQLFDGHTNRKTGVRRLYTSRIDHLRAAEVLAVAAGYTVNVPGERASDLSDRPNYSLTVSDAGPAPVVLPVGRQPGLVVEPNTSGKVWCVTVPSGVIVVRRHGFSMLCGNCAEALALRKAFPQELSGIYTNEEMAQADAAPQHQPPALPPPEPAATPEFISPTQVALLKSQLNGDWCKLDDFLKAQGVQSLETLPLSRFDRAVKAIDHANYIGTLAADTNSTQEAILGHFGAASVFGLTDTQRVTVLGLLRKKQAQQQHQKQQQTQTA
jgi:hypothetical protein